MKGFSIYNDRFGYLAANLSEAKPNNIISYKSQEKSLRLNFEANGIEIDETKLFSPLSEISSETSIGIIKTPKSADLFALYLDHCCASLSDDGMIVCGFMTKYFNKQILEVANTFFEEVEQSLAWKKSRLLILKKKRKDVPFLKLHPISFDHAKTGAIELQQYSGVFSSKNIDYATQFFIDHLVVGETDHKILDLGSGNGILSMVAKAQNQEAEMYLVDDSFLALESSKLNLNDANTHFHYNDTLDDIEDGSLDVVISNPPFHFEFETNIEIPVALFKQVHRCLKPGGKFKSVASKHLNFKTHLEPLFSSTIIVAENSKFVIYESVK